MKRLLAILILACLPTWAAIPASTQWEIRNGGNDTNGGGYSTGGTDMSVYDNKNAGGCTSCQSSSNNLSVTDAATTTTTTLTSVNADFTPAIVGNVVYLTIGGGSCSSGTVSAQWRHVEAYVDESTITLDAAPSGSGDTCTGVTMNIGGALASIGAAGAVHVAGNTIWVKYHATAFSSASASNNVATGRITLAAGTAAAPVTLRGYETTRGDETSNRPTLAWGVNGGNTYLVSVGAFDSVENLVVDGVRASYTGVAGVTLGYNSSMYRVLVKRCNYVGIGVAAAFYVTIDNTESTDIATANGAVYVTSGSVGIFRSYIHDNAAPHINSVGTGAVYVEDTILDTNTTYSAYTTSQPTTLVMKNCSVYNSGASGVNLAVASNALLINTVFEGNAAYGVNAAAASSNVRMVNCAFYNNATAAYTTATILAKNILGEITPTASVFVDAANANFALNNTAGAGMSLRRAGAPSTFTGSSTLNYRDVGAAQHPELARTSAYAQ